MFAFIAARPYDPATPGRFLRQRWLRVVCGTAIVALASPLPSTAQTGGAPQTPPADRSEAPRFQLPIVTVTALKAEEDRQKVPVSVTAVSKETIAAAGIHVVSEAAIYAPNTYFTDWSARKLSNARFRGIGSSPNNPGITTYIDGVPQISANTSSIELLDVDQIEFVRGPQSALFGRNTLGGLVNITSVRPAMSAWTGAASIPVGTHGQWAIRGGASGPIMKDTMSLGVSFAQVNRDGFTVNDVTGSDIDTRQAFSTKAQLLFVPNRNWEGRVIFTGERARDGDYALNDVAALRANPFHAARDFEGFVNRDVVGTTLLARRVGGPVVVSSTTGFLKWNTQDVTDLDYTPLPLLRRDNREEAFQFTQEIAVASADDAAITLDNGTRIRWQGGLFLFTQSYDQDAINSYAPFVVAPFAVSQHSPLSSLADFGLGVFGQATFTFTERLDVVAGARLDYESKEATLDSFFDPSIAPAASVAGDERFSNVSPQGSVVYRFAQDVSFYGTLGRGYKAGGFNPAAPIGGEAYGEEKTWHAEGGVKSLWANGRISTNAAVFVIDWDDLQLSVPNPAVPAQFYITNVGGATSRGVEVELSARAAPGVDLFTSLGYTHARFSNGSNSSGVDVSGNEIPNTPTYTTSLGAQYSRDLGGARLQGRADVVFYGDFQFNDANTLGQDAYSLVNLRLGATSRRLTGELFLRNAFDTKYIPFAFAYGSVAPSGFLGEMGAPRTFGVSVGVRF